MALSGVTVEQEVLDTYSEIKDSKKHRYIILGLTKNNTAIGVIKKAPRDASYSDFTDDLADLRDNKKTGCYAVYDIEFKLDSGQERSRIVFMSWIPDNTPIKPRMVLASSTEALKKKLTGLYKIVHAGDLNEASEDQMVAICKENDKGN